VSPGGSIQIRRRKKFEYANRPQEIGCSKQLMQWDGNKNKLVKKVGYSNYLTENTKRSGGQFLYAWLER
jgi:hypothetical protein